MQRIQRRKCWPWYAAPLHHVTHLRTRQVFRHTLRQLLICVCAGVECGGSRGGGAGHGVPHGAEHPGGQHDSGAGGALQEHSAEGPLCQGQPPPFRLLARLALPFLLILLLILLILLLINLYFFSSLIFCFFFFLFLASLQEHTAEAPLHQGQPDPLPLLARVALPFLLILVLIYPYFLRFPLHCRLLPALGIPQQSAPFVKARPMSLAWQYLARLCFLLSIPICPCKYLLLSVSCCSCPFRPLTVLWECAVRQLKVLFVHARHHLAWLSGFALFVLPFFRGGPSSPVCFGLPLPLPLPLLLLYLVLSVYLIPDTVTMIHVTLQVQEAYSADL